MKPRLFIACICLAFSVIAQTAGAFTDSGTFTVNKDFSDDDPQSVTFVITCTSGEVIDGSGGVSPASEFIPAVFTLSWDPIQIPTCVALEADLPFGYTADETDCAEVVLVAQGCCSRPQTCTSDAGRYRKGLIFATVNRMDQCRSWRHQGPASPPASHCSNR